MKSSALSARAVWGEVYRARDPRLNRDVAIKILPELFSVDAERVARFQREAHLLASLNHPNIAQIYGVEEAHGTRALVLELVDGPTLADRIAEGPIPLDDALPIAKQMAEALEAAHEHGIVHRDLKPANIKIMTDGTVKVLDFGLAKVLTHDHAGRLQPDLSQSPTVTSPALMTGANVILGTAGYMSPEQAKGRPAEKASDIWSFGAVLYEMITGKRAFAGDDVTDTIAAIVSKEPDWTNLPSNTPDLIRRLLKRCLRRSQRERLGDIHDARLDIEEALGLPLSQVLAADPLKRRRVLPWAISAVSLVLAAFALIAVGRSRPPATELSVSRFDVNTPPTDDPFSFALSQDGRQLAFVANGDKGSQLWIRWFDRTSAQPLANTDHATYPFWSQDGTSIGFFADGKLKRIDLTNGGLVRSVADAPNARGGTWSRDDVIVFAPALMGGLMRVSATGGDLVPFTQTKPGQYSHRWPQFLPDGRHLLFSMILGELKTRGTYVVSLDGGEPTLVTSNIGSTFAPPNSLLHQSQGVLFAVPFDPATFQVHGTSVAVAAPVGNDLSLGHGVFSASMNNGVLAYRDQTSVLRQMQWVDRTGKILGTVGAGDALAPSLGTLSPDERSAAVTKNLMIEDKINIWITDLARGVQSRLTTGVTVEGNAVWSPDGETIAYRSMRQGFSDIFAKSAVGGGEERPLLVSSQDKAPLDWSADGRFLLYGVRQPTNAGDLWVMPFSGDRKPFAVTDTPFDETQGQFSPDGRWISYASNESGRYEVYVRPFPKSAGRWQVSNTGGTQPRWRKDGAELFYVSSDNQLMGVTVRSHGDRFESDSPLPLFVVHLARGSNIASAGFTGSAQYAVSKDGRFLVNVSTGPSVTSPITIALNWPAVLKK
jgi:serine/threonine protein kinase